MINGRASMRIFLLNREYIAPWPDVLTRHITIPTNYVLPIRVSDFMVCMGRSWNACLYLATASSREAADAFAFLIGERMESGIYLISNDGESLLAARSFGDRYLVFSPNRWNSHVTDRFRNDRELLHRSSFTPMRDFR